MDRHDAVGRGRPDRRLDGDPDALQHLPADRDRRRGVQGRRRVEDRARRSSCSSRARATRPNSGACGALTRCSELAPQGIPGRLASQGGSLAAKRAGRRRSARRGDRSGSRHGEHDRGGHRRSPPDPERDRRPRGLPRDLGSGASGVGRPRQGEPPRLHGALRALGAPAVAHPGHRLQPRPARTGRSGSRPRSATSACTASRPSSSASSGSPTSSGRSCGPRPTEEQRIFLSTQIADEARHVRFFNRFYEEVGVLEGADDLADRLRRHRGAPERRLRRALRRDAEGPGRPSWPRSPRTPSCWSSA